MRGEILKASRALLGQRSLVTADKLQREHSLPSSNFFLLSFQKVAELVKFR